MYIYNVLHLNKTTWDFLVVRVVLKLRMCIFRFQVLIEPFFIYFLGLNG